MKKFIILLSMLCSGSLFCMEKPEYTAGQNPPKSVSIPSVTNANVKMMTDSENANQIIYIYKTKPAENNPWFTHYHKRVSDWWQNEMEAFSHYQNVKNYRFKHIKTARAFHKFTTRVDEFVRDFGYLIKQKDGDYKMLLPACITHKGEISWGCFEYIFSPKSGICFHRFFNPVSNSLEETLTYIKNIC